MDTSVRTTTSRMVVLNRLIYYEPETGKVTYEADPRHVEALVKRAEPGDCQSCKNSC